MKITVIGGGSTYAPELIDGLIYNAEKIDLKEVVLMDIDAERLKVVGTFCERMVAHAGRKFELKYTMDRAEAIKGADFIVTQIRVGKQIARHKDIKLGLRHGLVGQETTGVGGMAKALRTIPVMREIAEDAKHLAPNAWFINFTNPSGLITESLYKMGVKKIVGLCNIPIGIIMDLALHLQCDPDRIKIDFVGLNHLGWVRKIYMNGLDITEKIIDSLADKKGPANIPELDYDPKFTKALGFIPSPYLRYFYATETMVRNLQSAPKTRAEEVMEIEDALLKIYSDPMQVKKPAELDQRGGAFYSKIAVDLIDSIWNDKREEHIVNVPNQGAVWGIEDYQTVEIPAIIGRDKIEVKPIGHIEPKIFGLMAQVKAYETLTVEAGLEGSYDKALMALTANPLCPTELARIVLDDMIETHGLKLS